MEFSTYFLHLHFKSHLRRAYAKPSLKRGGGNIFERKIELFGINAIRDRLHRLVSHCRSRTVKTNSSAAADRLEFPRSQDELAVPGHRMTDDKTISSNRGTELLPHRNEPLVPINKNVYQQQLRIFRRLEPRELR